MATEERPRRVIGDARRWKALAHPLRGEILRHLDQHGSANSTAVAAALGESTGSTSYHLRVLADAGVIEEVPELARGRERWWRTIRVDHREPDYDSLSDDERAALDAWRALQIPGERELFERFLGEMRQHGPFAKAARAHRHFTAEELARVMDGFIELVNEHGHDPEHAPPGARAINLRMFYLPDDPPQVSDRAPRG